MKYKKIESILDNLDDIHNTVAGYWNGGQTKKVMKRKAKQYLKELKKKLKKL